MELRCGGECCYKLPLFLVDMPHVRIGMLVNNVQQYLLKEPISQPVSQQKISQRMLQGKSKKKKFISISCFAQQQK
jgi:hypothetical protein